MSLHQNVCLFSIQRNAFPKFLFSSWQITKQLFQNQGNQVWNTRTNTMTVTNPRVLQIKQNRILCSVNVILSRCIFNQNVTITRSLKRTNLCRIRRIYQQCLKTHLTNKKSTRLKYNKYTFSIKIVVTFTRYLSHFLSGKINFLNGFTYFHN